MLAPIINVAPTYKIDFIFFSFKRLKKLMYKVNWQRILNSFYSAGK